jgi:hypothetical protein
MGHVPALVAGDALQRWQAARRPVDDPALLTES